MGGAPGTPGQFLAESATAIYGEVTAADYPLVISNPTATSAIPNTALTVT